MDKLRKYLKRVFRGDKVDEDDLTEEILLIILLLFLLGSDYDDEGDLTKDDRKKLEETYQLTIATVAMMVDRHSRGMDMQPTIDRVTNHVFGIFFFAFAANGMGADDLYIWALGDTEHCVDCIEQANKGKKPGKYWMEMALSGIYPRSPMLYCTGLHCQCEIQEA